MTLQELKALLGTLNMPVAFDHFKTAQNLPYLVYIVASNEQFGADNVVYHSHQVIQLELYTELKDMTAESTVESVLASFYYEKEEGYLDDEQMYMVTYRFSI